MEGLYELTPGPSLTRAVWLSFMETTLEPGCRWAKKLKFDQIQTKFWPFHLEYYFFILVMRDRFIPAVNKVIGY